MLTEHVAFVLIYRGGRHAGVARGAAGLQVAVQRSRRSTVVVVVFKSSREAQAAAGTSGTWWATASNNEPSLASTSLISIIGPHFLPEPL